MIRALSVCLLLAGMAVAADNDADVKALEGTWIIDAATLDGRDHIDDFKGMKLILKGKDYTIQFAENSDKGTFTINTEKSPKWIDIKTGEKGPFFGKMLPGIYKLDGDTLVLCLHGDGKTRPGEFDAPSKTRNMLLTYKREKK
jgi:uncharacterized protein (TIGR03067 family)